MEPLFGAVWKLVLVVVLAGDHLRVPDLGFNCTWSLKTNFPQSTCAGIIRALACADNWVSVGNHNGAINTLDVRTGELLSLWKPADSATVQVGRVELFVCVFCLFVVVVVVFGGSS